MYLQQPKLSTLAIEKTVAIPDGATVVFGGCKKVSEVQYEVCPPVVSDIPYLNRLFKNIGYSRESLQELVLVTPRIIVNREMEANAVKKSPPHVGEQVAERCRASRCSELAADCPKQTASECGVAAVEEQEVPVTCETMPQGKAKVLAALLHEYDEACTAGRAVEARKFAKAALAIDPMCFHRKW